MSITLPNAPAPLAFPAAGGLLAAYGSPGSGMTHLLRHFAHERRETDAQTFVLPSPHARTDEYSDVVADATNVAQSADFSELDRIVSAVKARDCLLIDRIDLHIAQSRRPLLAIVALREMGANIFATSALGTKRGISALLPDVLLFLARGPARNIVITDPGFPAGTVNESVIANWTLEALERREDISREASFWVDICFPMHPADIWDWDSDY